MNNFKDFIVELEQFVKSFHKDDHTGHDWDHVHRVRTNAKKIAFVEGGNLQIIEIAALLHDRIDEKLVHSEQIAVAEVENWLIQKQVSEDMKNEIMYIITNLSFKGGNHKPLNTIEGQIVQDADRLDAIGAIGIARTFVYSGARGQAMYRKDLPPRNKMSVEEYRKGESTAINHFYEKLLKLKGLMNTQYGKQLAEERHRFMENYLEQFMNEWDGEK